MLDNFKYEVIANLARIRIAAPEEAEKMEEKWRPWVGGLKCYSEVLSKESWHMVVIRPHFQVL